MAKISWIFAALTQQKPWLLPASVGRNLNQSNDYSPHQMFLIGLYMFGNGERELNVEQIKIKSKSNEKASVKPEIN